MPNLKSKFVCFTCRKMFRIDPARFRWDNDLKRMVTEHPPICPDCGTLMRRVNRDFRRHAEQTSKHEKPLSFCIAAVMAMRRKQKADHGSQSNAQVRQSAISKQIHIAGVRVRGC